MNYPQYKTFSNSQFPNQQPKQLGGQTFSNNQFPNQQPRQVAEGQTFSNNQYNIPQHEQARQTNRRQVNKNQAKNINLKDPQLNSKDLLTEINRLDPIEQQKILKMLQGNNKISGQTSNVNDYYQNELIQGNSKANEMEVEDNQYLSQKQLDLKKLNQQLDYKDCWDFYYSAIATIENIALRKSEKKEYGKWDEFDACSFKDTNQLVIQLLKILKSFKGAYNDYMDDYNDIIDYPEDINITINKIKEWKKKINDPNINKYLDELINIINKRGKLDIQNELNKYYSKQKIEKEEMRKGFEAAMKCSNHVRKEEQKFKKEFEENGSLPKYKVELGIPAGRFVKNRNQSFEKKRSSFHYY